MDLFADESPRDGFDVVHARCVLEHLPDRVHGLERLIGAARPGGLVVVCDFGGDLGGPVHPSADDRVVQDSFLGVVNEAGWDHTWAPTIAEHMRQFGLDGVEAESFRRYTIGGDTGSVRINHFSLSVLRDGMIATGRVTARQIDTNLVRTHGVGDPSRDSSASLTVSPSNDPAASSTVSEVNGYPAGDN